MSETTVDAGKATVDGTPYSTSYTVVPSLHIKISKQEQLERDIAAFVAGGGRITEVPAGTRSAALKGDFNERSNYDDLTELRNRESNTRRSKQATSRSKAPASSQPKTQSKAQKTEKAVQVASINTKTQASTTDVKSIAARILEMRQGNPESADPQTPKAPKAVDPQKQLEDEARRKAKAEQAIRDKEARAKKRQKQRESDRTAKQKAKEAARETKAKEAAKAKEEREKERQKQREAREAARQKKYNSTVYKRTNETLVERKARLHELKQAREAAEAQGLKEFTARCWRHQTTTFIIDKYDCSRCVACTQENESKDRKRVRERREANRKALEEALEKGEITFIGQCQTHAKTEFKIENHQGQKVGRCVKCIQAKYQKEKRRNKRNHSNTIRIHLDALKDLTNPVFKNIYQVNRIVYQCKTRAVGKCKTEFVAPCNKHGLTTYRFNGPLIFDSVICTACENNEPTLPELTIELPVFVYQNESERKNIVSKQRKAAAIRNEVDFYAPCAVHGSTRYTVMGNNSRCIACVEIQKEKEKEKYSTTENYRRIERNQIKAAHAHFHGNKQFIGECLHHGLAPFSIGFRGRNYSGYTTMCIECNQFKCHRSLYEKNKIH